MTATKDYQFACQACREPFQILLPERVKMASFSKCEKNDLEGHNLTQVSKCKNCEQTNRVYYCIRGHWLRSPTLYEASFIILHAIIGPTKSITEGLLEEMQDCQRQIFPDHAPTFSRSLENKIVLIKKILRPVIGNLSIRRALHTIKLITTIPTAKSEEVLNHDDFTRPSANLQLLFVENKTVNMI